jgi:hypothetical protein
MIACGCMVCSDAVTGAISFARVAVTMMLEPSAIACALSAPSDGLAVSAACAAIDVASGAATQLPTASKAHAVVVIPDCGLLAETDGNNGSVRLIDRHSGAEIARIAVGEKPDAAFTIP